MEKTLQQQYNLIKEGKGNKDYFLKSARRIFPEFVTPVTDYNTAIHILKAKSILSEEVKQTQKTDWVKVFKENIQEVVGVKDKEEYGDQNTFKASKETLETLKKANFDNSNPDNIDNVYGQSFLLGFLAEMDDPKNKTKTVDEVKKIVAKNMAKDINYYSKNAMFSVKGIKGEQLENPKEPKGKYKSSGYGNLNESKLRSLIQNIIKEELE
jgi:tRNA U38,U39,U40 pseudouridine synthase TruA